MTTLAFHPEVDLWRTMCLLIATLPEGVPTLHAKARIALNHLAGRGPYTAAEAIHALREINGSLPEDLDAHDHAWDLAQMLEGKPI
jgi:hypothetical protein